MHYSDHLPSELCYDPFKAIVAPRPIGWIGTRGPGGIANLAPYSFFCAVSSRPNMVCFGSDGAKHSYLNARDTGVFTVSFVSRALFEAMNLSSQTLPAAVSEFEAAGLTPRQGVDVDAPFVTESPAAFECVTVSAEALTDRHGMALDRYHVIGEVVHTHIRNEFVSDGRFDTARARPVVRGGYRDYAEMGAAWEALRPDE